MKRKIRIVEYLILSKVNYYSLEFEDENVSEKERFDIKFRDSDHVESFMTLKYWLAVIGERRGAKSNLFRKESQNHETKYKLASALPPDSEILNDEKVNNGKYIGYETEFETELRLYCLRLSDSVVILYNGDVKTAQFVRDCSNCYPYFKNINSLSSQLNAKKAQYELVERRIKHATSVELEIEKL